MDSRLLIELVVDNNCNLVVVDNTNYDSWDGTERDIVNHAVLELLMDKNKDIINSSIKPIYHRRGYLLNAFSSIFRLPFDGTYTYRKLIVPCLEHFLSDNVYLTENKYFYYQGSFYYSTKNLNSVSEISSATKIDDFNTLWDNKEDQGFFWFDDNIFSICKLEKCLLSLQKKIINLCYTNQCVTNSDIKYKRDFILDSIFVLKYLITAHNFTEAQRILDNLSSCGNVCGDEFNSSLTNDCNCGNTI